MQRTGWGPFPSLSKFICKLSTSIFDWTITGRCKWIYLLLPPGLVSILFLGRKYFVNKSFRIFMADQSATNWIWNGTFNYDSYNFRFYFLSSFNFLLFIVPSWLHTNKLDHGISVIPVVESGTNMLTNSNNTNKLTNKLTKKLASLI